MFTVVEDAIVRDRRIIDISEIEPQDPNAYDYLIRSEL